MCVSPCAVLASSMDWKSTKAAMVSDFFGRNLTPVTVP